MFVELANNYIKDNGTTTDSCSNRAKFDTFNAFTVLEETALGLDIELVKVIKVSGEFDIDVVNETIFLLGAISMVMIVFFNILDCTVMRAMMEIAMFDLNRVLAIMVKSRDLDFLSEVFTTSRDSNIDSDFLERGIARLGEDNMATLIKETTRQDTSTLEIFRGEFEYRGLGDEVLGLTERFVMLVMIAIELLNGTFDLVILMLVVGAVAMMRLFIAFSGVGRFIVVMVMLMMVLSSLMTLVMLMMMVGLINSKRRGRGISIPSTRMRFTESIFNKLHVMFQFLVLFQMSQSTRLGSILGTKVLYQEQRLANSDTVLVALLI